MQPVLIIGYGNPSRGDDALGPALLEWLEQEQEAKRIPQRFDTLTDFQLQIEHALDLQGREWVLFVDASISANTPFEFTQLKPERDNSHSTHALSPAAVLDVYRQVCETPMPPAYLLSIRGYDFELGAPLSRQAQANLDQTEAFVVQLLAQSSERAWSGLTTG